MLSLSMTAIAQGDRDSNDGVKIVKGEKDLDVSTHIAVEGGLRRTIHRDGLQHGR